MSRTQRVVLLGVAAVIVIAAIVVLPGLNDDKNDNADRAAATQTQQAPEAPSGDGETVATAPSAAPKPKPKPPLLTANSDKQLTFDKGETVRFRVRHDAAEEVHVHGYDISRDIQPGKTATISFKATLEGIFEVELEYSATPLGTIKVEPK